MSEKSNLRTVLLLVAVAAASAFVGFSAGLDADSNNGQNGIAYADEQASVDCNVWTNETGDINYFCITFGDVDMTINNGENRTAESGNVSLGSLPVSYYPTEENE